MGWDVVQIGLKHDLPVDDIHATGVELSNRLQTNIRLVARNEYEYNDSTNTVSAANGDEFVILDEVCPYKSDKLIQVEVCDYQAKAIRAMLDDQTFNAIKYNDEWAEKLKDDLEAPFALYEIETDDYYIRIFKETVDLDICVVERYTCWERSFHNEGLGKEWLINYRNAIQERAKLFGCKKIIICCDQGPTMEIYDRMNWDSDSLLEYAKDCQYINDSTWNSNLDEWKETERHIDFLDYIDGNLKLADDEYVSIVYDTVNNDQRGTEFMKQ